MAPYQGIRMKTVQGRMENPNRDEKTRAKIATENGALMSAQFPLIFRHQNSVAKVAIVALSILRRGVLCCLSQQGGGAGGHGAADYFKATSHSGVCRILGLDLSALVVYCTRCIFLVSTGDRLH